MAADTQRPGPLFFAGLPIAYAIHIAEEFWVGGGFYRWVGTLAEFSAPSFLGVNFMIVSLLAVAAALAAIGRWTGILLVGTAVQFAVHGLVIHPVSSLWAGAFSPGLATGLLLLTPLAWWAFAAGRGRLAGAPLGLGVAAGLGLLASQDLWRVLFNALLGVEPVG